MGYERIEETEDPELALDRAMETYLKKSYSRDWINQRLKSIEVRKELTDEWEDRGIQKGREFAILTDEITKAWTGLSTREYKQIKSLKKENLRDHMTNMERVLNMLAEATTPGTKRKTVPVLFAGCRDSQTSADAWIGNSYNGAFTYYLCKHIRDTQGQLPRGELIQRLRASLRHTGFSQVPQLECPTAERKKLLLA